jgi:hypothetical protein
MSIAKFVTISYAVSSVIGFAVVGSLKAALAIKPQNASATKQ